MFKVTTMATAIALTLGAGIAQASTGCDFVSSSAWCITTGNNFTLLGNVPTSASTKAAPLAGGDNTTTFSWNSTYRTSVVTDGTYNATLASSTKLNAFLWTAHNVNIYGPGTYVFDTTGTTGNPVGTGTASQKYTLTVPTGYVGGHMLFDWNGIVNWDIVQLWKINDSWANTDLATTANAAGQLDDPFCAAPETTAACNTTSNLKGNNANTIFALISVDTPASISANTNYQENSVNHGTKMIDGPFPGMSFNFNLQTSFDLQTPPPPPPPPPAIPIPSAAWLLGSGLLGLGGVARKRKVA